ncbi:hypothetical protein ESCO_001974 [Escovopsis weberi]|uniref:Uncharacterized protein n=1 Tax=Escovopsis weberi TaxID=150374 RepID=A0A0M9VWX9_ESCWE|nr:hypothetical protein ESCO_001974 [Escovopsis weberi]
MKLSALFAALAGASSAVDFFEISIHAPRQPQLDAKVVNANGQAFVVGAAGPSTRCGLRDAQQCPPGASTLVTADMSTLGVVYVLPDGSVTYSLAHSGARPPVPQGRFFAFQAADGRDGAPLTVVSWRSSAGGAGLWACPASPGGGMKVVVLKASTAGFGGEGCVAVGGLRMKPAGSAFGAWEYT